jgi:hypothetical protein
MTDILMPRFDSKSNTAFAVRWRVGYSTFIQYFDTATEGNAFFATNQENRAEGLQRIGFASWDR